MFDFLVKVVHYHNQHFKKSVVMNMTASEMVSKMVECDRAVKNELEKLGNAMHAIMISDREFGEVWARSGGLERFIWNLHHRLALIVCQVFCRSKSVLCRLCELHRTRERLQIEIYDRTIVIHNHVGVMITPINSGGWRERLSRENEIYISSFLKDYSLYLKKIRELDKYSSAVPRVIPDTRDIAEFINLRQRIPSNCPAFRQFIARFREEAKIMDAKSLREAQEDAEQKKLRLREEFTCEKQQFENDLNKTALGAAFNGIGIDPHAAK